MARKNANPSPGVWLGLLLVLVAHTLALSTRLEKVPNPDDFSNNDETSKDSTVLRNVGFPSERLDPDEISTFANIHKSIRDYGKEIINEKRINQKSADAAELSNESNASSGGKLKELNIDEIMTRVETKKNHSPHRENYVIPTIATNDFENHLARNDGAVTVENTKGVSEIESTNAQANETADISEASRGRIERTDEGKPSTTSHQEFELVEEHENFEEHANSELAEATTSSSKLFGRDRQMILEDLHKNREHFDNEQLDDPGASNTDTIYLGNDTNVNYNTKFVENDTSISISDNGVSLEHKPKHEIEIFRNVTHPAILRISETTDTDMAMENTTPYYSSTSKPKGRTIPITGDNDLSTKEPKNVSHKKSVSTEKPAELKPYPYVKLDTKLTDDQLVTESSNQTEETTEETAAFENILDRRKSDEKIVVTEPSVLVENSIQQFKPTHHKRSGNSSRVNSTLDAPATSTAWSSAPNTDLASKNTTEVSEESQTFIPDNGNRSQINNDVPQDNPKESVTTERSPVILSEVTENNIETVIGKINGTYNLTASNSISKKLTERSEVTAEDIAKDTTKLVETQVSNSTEKIETFSNGSSTSNEIQTENEDSNITLNQFNVTEGSEEYRNLSTSTEIYVTSVSNATEKLSSEADSTVSSPTTISTIAESVQESSTEMPAETKFIEENEANVTKLETTPTGRESTGSITESSINQTTNVEYEFVELTTPGSNFTVSQIDVASSEKSNATTDFLNETTQTTESEATVTTEVSIELNETTVSRQIETVDPEIPALTTTIIFDTTTTSNSEVTTNEDLSNATSAPVSESSFDTETDVYTDTTLSSTSTSHDANEFHGRGDVTTSAERYDTEETTTTIFTETVLPTEETTTVSNIEIIASSEITSTTQTSTTVTHGTTLPIQSTSELPEFPISSEDVTLFVRVVIEGSWDEVCPILSNLRLSLANLLTEGTTSTVLPRNIVLHQTQCSLEATSTTTLTPVLLYVVDGNGIFDYTMTEILPSLYEKSPFQFSPTIRSVEKLMQNEPSNNAIAVVAVSSVAFICLVLLAGLLFIMRKRQTRFNYGERCRPVSLDAFRVDSVSAYNSVRRKGTARASKRSYGNPAFEDSSVTPTHPLNFAGLSSFCNDSNAIMEEFEGIPQVTARMDELPAGSEVKNRYANVAPLPETRVLLQKINNEPLTEYINANYVRGPKNAMKYYVACQAPMESTVSDFWRMIWEQQSKVIIMLTDIVENGVEKCVEYIPPSEVTDCHRLYGDYQVTLKKREAKEKYAISTLHLKNLENNTYREVSHIWYLWPTNGVPSNGTGLIAILLEARALQRGAPGPIVIHCSPGTGRTGTLIALDLGIRQYEITRTVDVPRVVYTIRRDRAGAVQTKEQYAFIYKALNLYAAKLAGGALESM